MIRIELKESQAEAEAERLLSVGGEVSCLEVLRIITDTLYDAEAGKSRRDDVVFVRKDEDKVREFNATSMCHAIQQKVDPRPHR